MIASRILPRVNQPKLFPNPLARLVPKGHTSPNLLRTQHFKTMSHCTMVGFGCITIPPARRPAPKHQRHAPAMCVKMLKSNSRRPIDSSTQLPGINIKSHLSKTDGLVWRPVLATLGKQIRQRTDDSIEANCLVERSRPTGFKSLEITADD